MNLPGTDACDLSCSSPDQSHPLSLTDCSSFYSRPKTNYPFSRQTIRRLAARCDRQTAARHVSMSIPSVFRRKLRTICGEEQRKRSAGVREKGPLLPLIPAGTMPRAGRNLDCSVGPKMILTCGVKHVRAVSFTEAEAEESKPKTIDLALVTFGNMGTILGKGSRTSAAKYESRSRTGWQSPAVFPRS